MHFYVTITIFLIFILNKLFYLGYSNLIISKFDKKINLFYTFYYENNDNQ